MGMNRAQPIGLRRAFQLAFLAFLGLALGAALARAQTGNPSSATNAFYGSVTTQPATDDTLKLSLDEAVSLGLKNNLGLKEAENSEKLVHGEKNVALQEFLPTIILSGATGVYQHDLAALGFGPSTIAKFGSKVPAGLSLITRDDLTTGQVSFSETLFSGPVIAAYKGAGAAERAAHFAKMSARGEVVQQVATAYLHAIAAASEVDNAKALEGQDQVQLDHAHDGHVAGTVANLDEIGVAPGQNIVLTDQAPYSELAAETPEEVRATAYKNRQDYQNLQNQAIEYKAIHAAYRSQRLPTLSFNGNYGTTTVTGVNTHGTFLAQGTLSIPLFREAKLRGDVEATAAQMDAINNQLADLRNHIDQQVRSALLDVDAAQQLVKVARSNVDLATRELSDETDRVSAGVDDNLPLVTAQASLASAQNNLVESLYQFNVAKLALARAAGVLETQYRDYIGR